MQLAQKQSGFAMIEVMVTVVIITIGISGMGLLLLRALQGTQDSAQLSQAMWIVQDYVGRIRANPNAARVGLYEMNSNNIECTSPPAQLCADTYKQLGGINTQGDWYPANDDCSADPALMAVYDNWMSTCSLHSSLKGLYDSSSNFIASKQLVSECISPTPADCVEYSVTLSWKTKVKQANDDEDDRTHDNEYRAFVRLN